MPRVAVNPELIRWARSRIGDDAQILGRRFPKVDQWETGEAAPTLKQLEDFAKATRVPFGFMFLDEPPELGLPVPDFRTVARRKVTEPSPDLLDTLYTMQRRQAALRELLLDEEAEPLPFVGSATLEDPADAIGREMRRLVGLSEDSQVQAKSWSDAVGMLREAIEGLGVMAVINGIVGNNTHRKLDVAEFRGFALVDPYAPLIFVNGADSKSAQMFTLAHELAHVWLGREGVSGFERLDASGSDVEQFCNDAAAEFLVPAKQLREAWAAAKRTEQPFRYIARMFKVSPLVAARRAADLMLIDRQDWIDFYDEYVRGEGRRSGSGGDFYLNQNYRLGRLFATRAIRAALEGRIGFKQAYDLTGLSGAAFAEYASKLGVPVV